MIKFFSSNPKAGRALEILSFTSSHLQTDPLPLKKKNQQNMETHPVRSRRENIINPDLRTGGGGGAGQAE